MLVLTTANAHTSFDSWGVPAAGNLVPDLWVSRSGIHGLDTSTPVRHAIPSDDLEPFLVTIASDPSGDHARNSQSSPCIFNVVGDPSKSVRPHPAPLRRNFLPFVGANLTPC
jgi:hypothetical protein